MASNSSIQQRSVSSIGSRTAELVLVKNRAKAEIIRRERDERLHRHLLEEPSPGKSPRVANDAEVKQVARLLNQRMNEIIVDPQARSWYKLFIHMDDDCSGKVNYFELEDMIRGELQVSRQQLSEEQLRAIWRALDEDKSGLITCGEFGHFMRRGDASALEPSTEPGSSRALRERQRVAADVKHLSQALKVAKRAQDELDAKSLQERAAAQRTSLRDTRGKSCEEVRNRNASLANTIRKDRDERLHRHLAKAPKGGTAQRVANQTEVEQVANKLNQRMNELIIDPTARSWFKLFTHMDDDCSGKVNFAELEDMIRNELKISETDLSTEQLKAVWRALDEDSSGLISCGEFGHFMRKGVVAEAAEPGTAKLLKQRQRWATALREENQALKEERQRIHSNLMASRYESAQNWRKEAWNEIDPRCNTALPWRSPRAIIF